METETRISQLHEQSTTDEEPTVISSDDNVNNFSNEKSYAASINSKCSDKKQDSSFIHSSTNHTFSPNAVNNRDVHFPVSEEATGQLNHATTNSSSHKSSTASVSAPDYQQLVEKLHKLGNEPIKSSIDNPLTNVIMCNQEGSSTNIIENGLTKTPCSSPATEVCECKAENDVLITTDENGIDYVRYESEKQMYVIMSLISKDLSEPYSIYTYRYFIHNWPNLCYLATEGSKTVGAIVCKLDFHKRTMRMRGYIAMLAVDNSCRRKRIGSRLVSIAIEAMIEEQADEIVLETEVTNLSALRLYEKLGFVRDKRLYKYYLNGVDAFRLKLWLT